MNVSATGPVSPLMSGTVALKVELPALSAASEVVKNGGTDGAVPSQYHLAYIRVGGSLPGGDRDHDLVARAHLAAGRGDQTRLQSPEHPLERRLAAKASPLEHPHRDRIGASERLGLEQHIERTRAARPEQHGFEVVDGDAQRLGDARAGADAIDPADVGANAVTEVGHRARSIIPLGDRQQRDVVVRVVVAAGSEPGGAQADHDGQRRGISASRLHGPPVSMKGPNVTSTISVQPANPGQTTSGGM